MGSTTNAGLAIAVIALLLGGFAFVRADAPQVMSSVNNIGAVTLATFSSLNMTTVGNVITLGINLAHTNIFTAEQKFNVAGDALAFLKAGTAQFLINVNDWGDNVALLAVGGSSHHATMSFYTLNGAGNEIQRLLIGVGNAGAAGITTYESIVASADNALDLGSSATKFANVWATTLHGALAWTSLTNFPSACSSAPAKFISAVGTTPTCSTLATYSGSKTAQTGSQAIVGSLTTPSSDMLVHIGCYLQITTATAGSEDCIVDFFEANTGTHLNSFTVIGFQTNAGTYQGDVYLWVKASTAFEVDTIVSGTAPTYNAAASVTAVATTP